MKKSNLIVARINTFVSFLVHYELELTSNNIRSHHFIHNRITKYQQHQNLLSINIGSDNQDLRLCTNHLTYYNTAISFEMLHNGKFYIHLDLNSKSSCSMIIIKTTLHAFFVCGSIESYFTYLLRESVTVKCK